MAIKFELVKAGDVLYDVHPQKTGKVGERGLCCWTVVVESINHVALHAMCRWNGNKARFYTAREIERLRRSPLNTKGAER